MPGKSKRGYRSRLSLVLAWIVAVSLVPAAVARNGSVETGENAKVAIQPTAIIDHVFRVSLTDKLQMKTAAEIFVWGLSNSDANAVWLIAPESDQARLGTQEAVFSYFSTTHPPLAHARSLTFDSISVVESVPIVTLYITDAIGIQWQASFAMRLNEAGEWKVMDCRLLAAPGKLI